PRCPERRPSPAVRVRDPGSGRSPDPREHSPVARPAPHTAGRRCGSRETSPARPAPDAAPRRRRRRAVATSPRSRAPPSRRRSLSTPTGSELRSTELDQSLPPKSTAEQQQSRLILALQEDERRAELASGGGLVTRPTGEQSQVK